MGAPSVLRGLRPGDDDAIRRLFRDTLALGRPLPFDLPDMDAYERLSLDWFLGPGRGAAAVLEAEGAVIGYTLVALDHDAYRRWAVPHAVAWGARTAVQLALGHGSPRARRFTWLRLVDGVVNWREAPPPPQPALMHFNVARDARALDAGVRLAAHVNEVCRVAGVGGWYGEVNARVGRRAAAFEQFGGRIVGRVPNRTMTWLAGRPIERLTVMREIDWPLRGTAPPMHP